MAKRNISVLLDINGQQIAICTEDAKSVRRKIENAKGEWLEFTVPVGGRHIYMSPQRALQIQQIVEQQVEIASELEVDKMNAAAQQPPLGVLTGRG